MAWVEDRLDSELFLGNGRGPGNFLGEGGGWATSKKETIVAHQLIAAHGGNVGIQPRP